MTTKKNLNVHPSKVWAILYPLYCHEAITMDYEDFAAKIGETWQLTPEQWGAVLYEWEFLTQTIIS